MGRLQNFDVISDEDKKIIEGLIKEKNNYEIAEDIGYSYGEVKRRLKNLFRVFGVKGRLGLIREFFFFNNMTYQI